MVRTFWNKSLAGKIYLVLAVVVLFFVFTGSVCAWYFSDRVVPHTMLGAIALGGLNRDQAAERIQIAVGEFSSRGLSVAIDGTTEVIQPESIGFDLDVGQVLDLAFARGHSGGGATRVWQRVSALWNDTTLQVPVRINQEQLASQLADLATANDIARRDIRLSVTGTSVQLFTDTKPGRAIDREQASRLVSDAVAALSSDTIVLPLIDDVPRADLVLADTAVMHASKMLSRGLSLQYEELQFYISRERIGSWIRSDYDGTQLLASLDREAISQYVTNIAAKINIAPEPPSITTQDGRVTGFTPPKVGRAVQEDELVTMIIGALNARTGTDKSGDTLLVPMKISKLAVVGLDEGSGITELVGKATTPFTGSPKNRISNIKNGIKFLSGTIIQPGTEFSTLATLGTIDNTTGYLPELVIKGDRTTPEFGGGLCQVSTTLFRAVMNAGLPITERRNHSYRVSYYEKDGEGHVIGPGLDATIYEPAPDFKFMNDTAHPILIIGYVIGDKATFELYGTKDGRTSTIIGPKTLTQTPPGPPVYIETDTLAPGVIKQVETPHPGGSAVATYTITYADGTTKPQEFRSWYRPWPAKYLKGVPPGTPLNVTPTPVPSLTP